MVQALLTSIRGMLGSQSTQTKEFKEEAVRNNKNVSSVLKDLSSMFSASRSSSARQSAALSNIENISGATSAKVDRTNNLLQESISLQNQMLIELRTVSRSLASVMTNNQMNPQQQGGSTVGNLIAGGLATAAMAGLYGAGAAALGPDSTAPGNTTGNTNVNPTRFSGSNREAFAKIEEAAKNAGSPDPKMTASIAMLESGWLQSSMTQRANNPFGQTITEAQIGSNGITGGTRGADGQLHAVYESLDAAIAHHIRRWGNKYTSNPDETLRNLVSGGYNTVNPAWSRSVNSIYMGASANNGTVGQERDIPVEQMTGPIPRDSATGYSGGNVMQRQRELAGIRKGDLSPNLVRILELAARAAGVDVVVYSGGQPSKASGQGPRTGSTRHDNGNAADLYLTRGNRKLSDTNPEDRATMAKFVSAAVSSGATGVGAGHSYMGPSNIHVGFGNPATWGGAPWIAAAASGVYSNQDLQAQGGEGSYAGNYGQSGGNVFGGMGELFGALGMPGGNLMSLISMAFGFPAGMMFNTANMGMSETGEMSNFTNYEEEEEEPEGPGIGPGRSAGPGGVLVGQQPEAPGTSEADDFSGMPNSKTKTNPLLARLQAIQQAAVEENVERRTPIVVNNPPETQAYTGVVQRAETPTTFAEGDLASARETRASWAPRIAVLRPDDNATAGLNWAARITGSRA